jgi:hypothetical protein
MLLARLRWSLTVLAVTCAACGAKPETPSTPTPVTTVPVEPAPGLPLSIDGPGELHLTLSCGNKDGTARTREEMLEGQVVRSGDHLRYQANDNPSALRLQIDLAGLSASGTIVGQQAGPKGLLVMIWKSGQPFPLPAVMPNFPATATGNVVGAGTVAGSIDGEMGFWYMGDAGTCGVPNLATYQANTWRLVLP